MTDQTAAAAPTCRQNSSLTEDTGALDPTLWRISTIDAIAAALQPRYKDDCYNLLMGICGMAFRIHTLPREIWCPSCMSINFGFNALESLISRESYIGLNITRVNSTCNRMDEYICESIDRGYPVVANGPWWIGIISAYSFDEEGGREYSVITYENPPECPLQTSYAPSSIILIEGIPQYPNVENAKRCLQTALFLSGTNGYPTIFGEYLSGMSAWNQWADNLEVDWDSDGYNDLVTSHEEDGGIAECHHRNLAWLASCRASASVFTRAISEILPSDEGAILRNVSESYNTISRLLSDSVKTQQWNATGRALLGHAINRSIELEANALEQLKRIVE